MQKKTKIITGVICATVILGGAGVALAKPAFITQLASGTTTKAPTQIVEAPTTIGKLTLPEGTYDGEIKNGMANGKGTITFPNGDYWVGGFTDNKWHGIGMITYLREGQPPNTKELDVDKIQVFVDTRNADGLYPEPAGINDAPNDGYYHMRTDRPAGIVIYQIIFHEGFRPAGLKAVDVHIMARSHAKENELVQDRDEIVSITGSTGKVYSMIGTKRTGVNTNAYFENFQEQEITEYQDVSINEKTITSIVVRRDGKDITIKPDKDTKYDTTYAAKATTATPPAKTTPAATTTPTPTKPTVTKGKLTLELYGMQPKVYGDYTGEIVNGMANGQGIVHWNDIEGRVYNHTFEGEFKDNHMYGKGTHTWTDKDGKVHKDYTTTEGIA